ncbi:MAG: hypothetical protein C0456_10640 [Hyphomonas sp.]|uniref:trypsin-like serine peptidase n=1 Tax=Hyphomonas sp. TaxID=87 RepID=UPI001DC5C80F|nr:serine protease [Hyphomonas sp.]MBA4227077.1 hypothetical protein [Hyphomonas sp.]
MTSSSDLLKEAEQRFRDRKKVSGPAGGMPVITKSLGQAPSLPSPSGAGSSASGMMFARADLYNLLTSETPDPELSAASLTAPLRVIAPERLFDIPDNALRSVLDEMGSKFDKGLAGLERIMLQHREILDIEFLAEGLLKAQSVGQISTANGKGVGTGFFIAENLIITNNHVLPTEDSARSRSFVLNFERYKVRPPLPLIDLDLDPGTFFATDTELDFTIIAVKSADTQKAAFLPLRSGHEEIFEGQAVSMIQFPGEGPKSIVVHNSALQFLRDNDPYPDFCNYTTDTERGSSGSPVFNTNWDVIALHRRSIPRRNEAGEILDRYGKPIPGLVTPADVDADPRVHWISNEGIRTSSIVRRLSELELKPKFRKIRTALLNAS